MSHSLLVFGRALIMWRAQVYVRQRREILLKDSAAGLVEGRWKWTVSVD